MLTELGVVLCSDLAGLAFAGLLLRSCLRGPSPNTEARRLVNAATRAAEAFLFRAGKLAVIPVTAVIALVLAVHAVSVVRKIPGSSLPLTLWTALAVLVGAGITMLAAYIATEVGLAATLRGARAAQVSQDQALTFAVRPAGAVALVSETMSTAAALGFLGLLYLLGGGALGNSPDRALDLLDRARQVLPGLGMGSIAIALVLGMAGATYRASAEAGMLAAPGLEPWDSRNPSMVVDLVGDHLGRGAKRAADAVAVNLLANTVLVSLGVAALRGRADLAGTRAFALVSLPLVVRGVGTIASAFGVTMSHTRDGERASFALWRGQLVAAVLVLGGLAGAGVWLLGAPSWPWFLGAGALGVIASAGIVYGARRRVDRRHAPVQDLLDGARTGPSIPLLRGFGRGQQGVLPVFALLASAACGAYWLGQRSGIPSGGLLATATALSCLVSLGLHAVTAGLLGPIASGAMAAAALDSDASRGDARRRAGLIDEAGFEGSATAESLLIVIGCLSALLAGLGIPLSPGGVAEPGPILSLARSPVLWGGLLGAAFLATVSGLAVRRAARAAKGVLVEVERQLRVFPRENGVPQIPEAYTPSYRSLVELTARSSTESLVLPIALCLFTPVLLGIGLRVLYTSPGIATEGLTSFVVIASATGLGAALAMDGSRAVLGAAYRASRPRGTSPGFEALLSSHAFGSIAFDMVASSAHSFVKTAATMALLIAPLLT